MNLNLRERERQALLKKLFQEILQFETTLLDARHNREHLNLIFLSVWSQMMSSKGVNFYDMRERRAHEFLQVNVNRALILFANGDAEEFNALEGRVLKHFAEVVERIRDAELLRKDTERQRAAAATN